MIQLCMLFLLLPLGLLGAAPAQTTPPAGTEPVRIGTLLIDAVVRDRAQRQVTGLGRDDFALRVDDRPVDPSEILSHEEVCSSGVARHLVLYLDFSQMTLGGRQRVLKAARDRFAAGLDAADRVMIVTHKRGLRLVQEFTGDGALLVQRLEELLDDTSTLDTDVLEESDHLAEVARGKGDRAKVATEYAVHEAARARRSLKAIQALLPTLAPLPGRKALVLMTDVLREEPGLPYLALAGLTSQAAGTGIAEEIARLTREANAAGVSFYTAFAGGAEGRQSDEPANAARDKRAAAAAGDRSALAIETAVADQTGGHAARSAKPLEEILAVAQQDLACYYVLGYGYKGRGDGKRHTIEVRLEHDGPGATGGGMTVRHRPFYTDEAIPEKRTRLVGYALTTPEVYRAFPVTAEAFALAPEGQKRRVLIKTTVKLDSLSMTSPDPAFLEARALVRGDVSREGESVCAFKQDLIELKTQRAQSGTARLVYQSGCLLEPGPYTLTVAVMDRRTNQIGTKQTPLVVPPADTRKQPFLSDVHLWVKDREALVVAAGTEKIGLKQGAGESLFVPLAERRITGSQEAILSFLVCPPAGATASRGSPIEVRQTLSEDSGIELAEFERNFDITDPPDEGTGCYQVSSAVPPGKLRTGIYNFTVKVMGKSIGTPLVRQAAVAVN